MRHRPPLHALFALAVALAALAPAGCGSEGSGDDVDAGAGNPSSAATGADFARALADAPGPLADLYAEGDAVLDGGVEAFEEQLGRLRGHPVVVNKWASWCGPCRFEFPFFQTAALDSGDRVAFIGVNSKDSDDAAETFLEELPLPYPSYADPDHEIGDLFESRVFPVTAFYDDRGELVYVHQGQYASEDDLTADIEEYAREDG